MNRKQMRLGNVMVDCKDEFFLQDFYHRLLGWEKITRYGCPGVESEEGVTFLFQAEIGYVPPVWPEEGKEQQKQMHFDFQVVDVEEAVTYAQTLGATLAKSQYGGKTFVTLFDPAGHPFCLCAQDNPTG